MPPRDDSNLDYLDNEILMGFRAQSMGRDQNEVVYKMRELGPELVQSYLSTKYITSVQGEEVVLRIGELPPSSLNALSETRSVKSWSIITAYNPYSVELSDEENIARQGLLANILVDHGYESQPAYGQGEDAPWMEPSILVFGISYEMAKSIGTCFQQNAIVFGQADHQIELVFCDREAKQSVPDSVQPPAERSTGSRPQLNRHIGKNNDVQDTQTAAGMREQTEMTNKPTSTIPPTSLSPTQAQAQASVGLNSPGVSDQRSLESARLRVESGSGLRMRGRTLISRGEDKGRMHAKHRIPKRVSQTLERNHQDNIQCEQFRELFNATIRFGKAAYQYSLKYGGLPEGAYNKSATTSGQKFDPFCEILLEYDSSMRVLLDLSENRNPDHRGSKDLWLKYSGELESDDLGYLIAGLKAASESFLNWPRGSVNSHEAFIENLIVQDDRRLWDCRAIPNAIKAWAYYGSENIPSRESYFQDQANKAELSKQREAASMALHRKIMHQDKVTEEILGTREHKDLIADIFVMSPIQQLYFIVGHEEYSINLYPPEIARNLQRDAIQQLDDSSLTNLVKLLNHRVIADQRWGKFKNRLLGILRERNLQ